MKRPRACSCRIEDGVLIGGWRLRAQQLKQDDDEWVICISPHQRANKGGRIKRDEN